MTKEDNKRDSHEWGSAFDRDLIRFARDRVPVEIFMDDEEQSLKGIIIISVDRDFIKVKQLHATRKEFWLNRFHISKVMV